MYFYTVRIIHLRFLSAIFQDQRPLKKAAKLIFITSSFFWKVQHQVTDQFTITFESYKNVDKIKMNFLLIFSLQCFEHSFSVFPQCLFLIDIGLRAPQETNMHFKTFEWAGSINKLNVFVLFKSLDKMQPHWKKNPISNKKATFVY